MQAEIRAAEDRIEEEFRVIWSVVIHKDERIVPRGFQRLVLTIAMGLDFLPLNVGRDDHRICHTVPMICEGFW